MRRVILQFSCLILLLTTTVQSKGNGPVLRVKLGESPAELAVALDEYVKLSCFREKEQVADYNAYGALTVRLVSGKIQLLQAGGILESELDEIKIMTPNTSNFFNLNGKNYRGDLKILVNDLGKSLIAINIVRLEDYLKGVVPLEMGIKLISDPKDKEALKVQAVAARTYALAKLGQYPDRPFDLESTVADQVYGGVDIEEKVITQAINQTKGEILVNDNHLVKAYFHANCGGHTVAIEKAWPWKEPEHYLLARPDSEYCNWAKNYSWSRSWSKEELERNISNFFGSLYKDTTFNCGFLEDLAIVEQSQSGRALLFKIKTEYGEWEIKSDSIRWCFRSSANNGILPSTKFELNIFRSATGVIDSVSFSGFGNGHGVGMCQIGALGRARAGQNYKEILAYYYPGARLVKRY